MVTAYRLNAPDTRGRTIAVLPEMPTPNNVAGTASVMSVIDVEALVEGVNNMPETGTVPIVMNAVVACAGVNSDAAELMVAAVMLPLALRVVWNNVTVGAMVGGEMIVADATATFVV